MSQSDAVAIKEEAIKQIAKELGLRVVTWPETHQSGDWIRVTVYDKNSKDSKAFGRKVKADLGVRVTIPKEPYWYRYTEYSTIPVGTTYTFNVQITQITSKED